MTTDQIANEPTGRWRRLKEATETTHERLDHRIMASKPFASRERYGLFLKVQHAFHQDIAALYDRPDLKTIFADLSDRRRGDKIAQDLVDLGIEPVQASVGAAPVADADLPTAIGWLYVAEGSNLGAAFLLKAAARLGLDENLGARHLAAAPEGRAVNWRKFTTALDATPLSDEEEQSLFAGARDAFARVQALVDATLPRDEPVAEAVS